MKRTTISIGMLLLVLSSCYYDKEKELYGTSAPCSTATVTYSGNITNLLTANGCIGCHSGSSPSGNINLQGYANIKASAASGKLFGAVNHSPGFSPMPKGGNQLSNCSIQQLKAWIDAGMPNN
jgi:hypothetical protein